MQAINYNIFGTFSFTCPVLDSFCKSTFDDKHGLRMDESSKSLDRTDKRIVLVCDDVFPEDFHSLSEHQSALQKQDGQKEIIFYHVKPLILSKTIMRP